MPYCQLYFERLNITKETQQNEDKRPFLHPPQPTPPPKPQKTKIEEKEDDNDKENGVIIVDI
jgi:hypothetical protein